MEPWQVTLLIQYLDMGIENLDDMLDYEKDKELKDAMIEELFDLLITREVLTKDF